MIGLLVCVALLLQAVAAVNVTVDLGYARYRGKDVGNGIIRWAGMRYARSVSRVDGLRFTAPQEPLEEANKVTTDASKVSTISKLNPTGRRTVSTSMCLHPQRLPTPANFQSMSSSKEVVST